MKNMKTTTPTSGLCTCRPGQARDNCPHCEGTGRRIDFAALRSAATAQPAATKGRYRTADGAAMIEWELEPKENGLEFSATGEYDGGAGQCLDSIARDYPDDKAVQRICAVWSKYHLNGMNAGTPEQAAEIERREALARKEYPGAVYPDGSLNWYSLAQSYGCNKGGKLGVLGAGHYELACRWLKDAGLYEVRLPHGHTLKATGGFENISDPVTHELIYKYGTRWIFNEIPAEVQAEIRSWSDFGKDDGRSLGDCKTDEFLARHGLKLRITLSDTKPANWTPAGHHYRITLSGGRRRLTFDFWGSAADADTGKEPSAYSVLSCAASDINTPESFEEFCSEYGEESDSRKALQTFNRADRFARRLRAFFTDAERTDLEAIR